MKKIVFLTGAGISAESGIPTFRDAVTGLWENHRVEEVATAKAIKNNPELVYNFINQLRFKYKDCVPNLAHYDIAELEKKYEVVFVNGEKAEFLKDGSWEKVDCKYSTVPTGIVPQAIKDYVSKHYPEAKILKIERDSKTYEVKLNNQLELEFNKAFQLIDIDN